jgi:hypothetical protein
VPGNGFAKYRHTNSAAYSPHSGMCVSNEFVLDTVGRRKYPARAAASRPPSGRPTTVRAFPEGKLEAVSTTGPSLKPTVPPTYGPCQPPRSCGEVVTACGVFCVVSGDWAAPVLAVPPAHIAAVQASTTMRRCAIRWAAPTPVIAGATPRLGSGRDLHRAAERGNAILSAAILMTILRRPLSHN